MKQLVTLALTFLAPLALAQTLSTEQATDFLDSLEDVEAYVENLDPELRSSVMDMDIVPENGIPLAPYEQAIQYVEEQHPEIFEDIGEITREYNFATPSEWAATGDRVAIAYIAMQMENEDMQGMNEITPEMLEQVPAQMRPQIEMVMAMLEAIENTPQENIEVVRPLADRMQQYMEMGEMSGMGMGQ